MHTKSRVVAASVFVMATLLAACNAFDGVAMAENRLAAEMALLSHPRGAVMLDQMIRDPGGPRPECRARSLEVLYGTNELSMSEVLEYYALELPGTKWKAFLSNAHLQGFRTEDNVSLSISDYLDLAGFDSTKMRDATSKYRTVYVLSISTFLRSPVPSHCVGG